MYTTGFFGINSDQLLILQQQLTGLATTVGNLAVNGGGGDGVDLSAYALRSELPDVSTKADRTELLPLALKTEIPDVTTKADSSAVATALAGKSDVSHLHDDRYATKASTYTKSEVDTSLSSKVNTADVYTKTMSDATYQTKSNMLTVGSESTYASKAYTDTLYAPIGAIGSAGLTFTEAIFGSPDPAVWNPNFPGNAGGQFILDWVQISNATPLTFCSNRSGAPSNYKLCLQNQTATSYRVDFVWELGMFHNINSPTVNDTTVSISWLQYFKGLPLNPTFTELMNGGVFTTNVNATVTDCFGMQSRPSTRSIHYGSASLTVEPNDAVYIGTYSAANYTAGAYTTPTFGRIVVGKVNRLYVRVWS